MKKSEYDALELKVAAELQEVYEKNKSLVHYKTMIESEAASVSWAIGQVLQKAYDNNCKYHYSATLDAIEQFSYAQFSIAHRDLEFEPETTDSVLEWAADFKYPPEAIALAAKALDELNATYKTKLNIAPTAASINAAGQLVYSMTHPQITSGMAASGPWPQSGCHPYIPTTPADASPQTEEKPPEDSNPPSPKSQSAAEDFSAIAKRMKELAAGKGNS